MGRKIASEDAARVLEIIGRPEPEDFLGEDLGDRSKETVRPAVLAPRVGLEPTTLRLTDACRSLIGPRDVDMRRSPGGVQVRHGAARCGHNCGQMRRPTGWGGDPRPEPSP